MSINDRIRRILSQEKIADKTLAGWLGVSAGRLSQKFKDGIWDSLGELKIVAEKTGYTLDWIIMGKGKMKPADDSGSVVREPDPAPYGAADQEEIYRNIVEGNTEYLLIPRSVLQERYRLVSLEHLDAQQKENEARVAREKVEAENKEKIIDRLLSQNEKLFAQLTSSQAESSSPKKAKKDS